MQILFADETEQVENGRNNSFFCISSLSLEEAELRKINIALDKVKDRHNLANLKDLRNRAFPLEHKKIITEDIFTILKAHEALARASIIGHATLSKISSNEKKYIEALSFLVERWFVSLRLESKAGMVIFDRLGSKREPTLSNLFYEYVSKEQSNYLGKTYGFYKNHIYPTLLFSSDEHCPMLQAADLIGVSLKSAATSAFQDNEAINVDALHGKNDFLKIYWPLFNRNPKGEVDGWGIKLWY